MPLDASQAQPHGRPAQPTSHPTVGQPAADEPLNDSHPKPNDARTIEAILKSMGVDEFDPRVTHQLLELLYRHVSNILLEARQYSEHADKQAIDADDVRLAINSRSFSAFAQPPPRQVIAQLASERNAIPLPPVQDRQGILLPKSTLQLARRNYMISKANKRQRSLAEDARRRSPVRRQQPTSGAVITIDVDTPEKNAPSPRPPLYARQATDIVNVDYPSTSRSPNLPAAANLPTNSSFPVAAASVVRTAAQDPPTNPSTSAAQQSTQGPPTSSGVPSQSPPS